MQWRLIEKNAAWRYLLLTFAALAQLDALPFVENGTVVRANTTCYTHFYASRLRHLASASASGVSVAFSPNLSSGTYLLKWKQKHTLVRTRIIQPQFMVAFELPSKWLLIAALNLWVSLLRLPEEQYGCIMININYNVAFNFIYFMYTTITLYSVHINFTNTPQ